MPKLARELSDSQVRRLKWGRTKSGPNQGNPCAKLHAVGAVGGLYLHCRPPPSGDAKAFARSWILRVRFEDSLREEGLGPYPEVSLSSAREKARQYKENVRNGIDPRQIKAAMKSKRLRAQAKAITFIEIGRRYESKKSKEYKTAKQVQKLKSHLETYVYPYIGKLVVSDIERAHIVQLLSPHWETKTETMTRIRALVENILDMAGAEGLRSGDNPARWKGNLELSLPAPSRLTKVKHFAAMSLSDLPEFMEALEQKTTIGALALRFGILTAARSGEIRGTTWDEIDLDTKVWTIPKERMKGNRVHKVPLSPDAVKLIKKLPRDNDLVFPSPTGRQLSDMTLTKVLKDMGHKVTQHGFRATFRTWSQEHTNYAEEVCELALAHVNSDHTRAAYARSELLEKRRQLMQDWQWFCERGDANGNIVMFGSA